MKRKAYSYIRMSTNIQLKGDSLRRQLELSKKHADENDLELVSSYEDIGVSGFGTDNVEKGFFGVFLKAIQDGEIKAGSILLVESLDRLSRDDVLSAFSQFSQILNNDIEIRTLTDNQIYTKKSINNNVGQLFTSIGIMLRANDESKIKSIRLKSTWENKRNNLNIKKYTSLAPSWLKYDKKNNNFTKSQQPVKTIQYIFELSTINGMGSNAIASHLNQNTHKYPPIGKGEKWHKSYIQKILNNRSVIGEFQPHQMVEKKRKPVGESIQDYFPKIISEELFDLSQAKQAERKMNGARRKGNAFTNLFTRLIICGSCGATVVYRNKGKPPKGGQYLKCGNSDIKHKCDAPTWEYNDFEELFFKFIIELDIEKILNDKKSLRKRDKLQNQLSILEHQLKEKNQEYSLIIERSGVISDIIYDDFMKNAEKVKIKIKTTSEEIQKIKYHLIALDKKADDYNLSKSIDSYKKSIENKNEEEQKFIRQKIHASIKEIISEIKMNNTARLGKVFDHDVLDDILPTPLIVELKRRRYRTEHEQKVYLNTEYGQRLYNHYTREFSVIFKNGVTKNIIPSPNSGHTSLRFNPPNAK